MAGSLRGLGKDPPVVRFDRTQVSQRHAGLVKVIPLDQVDHIAAGKQDGPFVLLVVAVAAIIAGIIAYALTWAPADIIIPALCLLIAAGAIAGYILYRPRLVRIQSAHGDITQRYHARAAGDAVAFVEGLLAARTEFLEGVYEEAPSDAAGAEDAAPTEPSQGDSP